MAGSKKGYARRITLNFDYAEVEQGTAAVGKQMAILNAEYKASQAEVRAAGTEVDKYAIRQQYLQERIKLVNERQAENIKRLEAAKEKHGEGSNATEKYYREIQITNANLRELENDLSAVTKELGAQEVKLAAASNKWTQMGDSLQEKGKALSMYVTAPLVAAGAASIKLASDYVENLNKVEEVFGSNTEVVKEWATTSIVKMGMAKSTAYEMASLFGDMGYGMGLNTQKTLDYSLALTQLAADIASFKNVSLEEAQTALAGIYTGSTESLKKLGIVMTEANLQQFAYTQGITKKINAMTQAEKVELRYAYVMSVTTNAQGDFERTGGDAANQMRQFTEIVKDLGSNFGKVLLPGFVAVLSAINATLKWINSLNEGTRGFIVTVLTIIATLGPVLIILGKIMKSIADISAGGAVLGKGIGSLKNKGASLVGGILGSGFFGMLPLWAKIMLVAGAIALVIGLLNVLIGKGEETSRVLSNVQGTFSGIQGQAQQGYRYTYASGTSYHPGGTALVGEEGPELVNLPRGSQVYTADQTRELLGTGDTFIIKVDLDEVSEVRKLVDVVKGLKQARRAGYVPI